MDSTYQPLTNWKLFRNVQLDLSCQTTVELVMYCQCSFPKMETCGRIMIVNVVQDELSLPDYMYTSFQPPPPKYKRKLYQIHITSCTYSFFHFVTILIFRNIILDTCEWGKNWTCEQLKGMPIRNKQIPYVCTWLQCSRT